MRKIIKERIEDEYLEEEKDSFSPFYLVEVYKNEKNEVEINEILSLEKNTDEIELSNNQLIVDRDGNILIDNFYNGDIIKASIMVVDSNSIIERIQKQRKRNGEKKLDTICLSHYVYTSNMLKLCNHLCHETEGERLIKAFRPSLESDVIYVNKIWGFWDEIKKDASLYSVKRKDYITPKFEELELVEGSNGKLFKFRDTIKSTEKVDGEAISTALVGFINNEGLFSQEIYDERDNKVRVVDLNSHPETMQYKSLKKALIWHLNNEAQEINEKEKEKQDALKTLELKAKEELNK